MSRLFTLPKEVLLKAYSYLTPKELFTLSTAGDTRLKRVFAIEALFNQNSDEAVRWQRHLFELWALNPNDSIVIGKKQIIETINRPANNRRFRNYFDKYHLSLGLSLASNRVIDGHSVRLETPKTITDEEIRATFAALKCENEQKFNSALRKTEHLMGTHTPFMTHSQLEYCLNEIWFLLQHNNHPANNSALYMLDKLAKHIPSQHLDLILNQFQEKGSINIPVFLKIATRLDSAQCLLVLKIILDQLENKIHLSSYRFPELIRSISSLRPLGAEQLEPLNNWIMFHLEDKDVSIRGRALMFLKLVANRIGIENSHMLLERVLEKLNGEHQTIDEDTIEQLEIIIPLLESKKKILVQPLLNYLEYLARELKNKPFVNNYKITPMYRKTLGIFSNIPFVLSNEDVDRLLKLLALKEGRLDDAEIKLIQSLSEVMTIEQRLDTLSPLLNDPENQNYQARAQAIQLLPLIGEQLTDEALEPVIEWALDNLETVHYQVKYQIPLIIQALASRITVEQLNPRFNQLFVHMQSHEVWVVRGAYTALETLGLHLKSKQLVPLLNWVHDVIQNQQDRERNEAMLSLLPVFSRQMTPVELAPACNLFVDNFLQNQQNHVHLKSRTPLIPVFINLMTSEQLILIFNWFFSGLNDTSDDNTQIIRQTRLQLSTCIDAMDEKQLLVTLNLVKTHLESVDEGKAFISQQHNWLSVFDELMKHLDYSLLVPVLHWATAHLNHDNNQIRYAATMVVVRLGDFIEQEETGILVLNNILSNSYCAQEHILLLLDILLHEDAKNWQSTCALLLTVMVSDTLQDKIYNVSGALRTWLLHNVHVNLDSQDKFIESDHFDKVLSYLHQECIALRNNGADNTDFLFLIHILELCTKLKYGIEYDNQNRSSPNQAAPSGM